MDLNEEIRIIPLENLPENSDCTIKHIESYGSNRKVDLEVELK